MPPFPLEVEARGALPNSAIVGRKVFAVEDDYHLAPAMSRTLEAGGATVIGPAPSVRVALRLLGERRPDAPVLDVDLGGETAVPVADALAFGRRALHVRHRRRQRRCDPSATGHAA